MISLDSLIRLGSRFVWLRISSSIAIGCSGTTQNIHMRNVELHEGHARVYRTIHSGLRCIDDDPAWSRMIQCGPGYTRMMIQYGPG